MNLSLIDITLAIFSSFLGWVSITPNGRAQISTSFFISGRNSPWWLVEASMAATIWAMIKEN